MVLPRQYFFILCHFLVQHKVGSSILHNSVPSGFKNSEFHGCLTKFHSDTKFPGNLPKHHTLEICHKYSFEKKLCADEMFHRPGNITKNTSRKIFFFSGTYRKMSTCVLTHKGKIINVHSATQTTINRLTIKRLTRTNCNIYL